MCRIAGLISNRLQPEEIRNKVQIMCHQQRHGGPDDHGIFTDTDKHLCFGHRRLALIDLSKNGHQPMTDSQERIWITFNGEIYNYLDLKRELISSGVKFESGSDTEVIIQAYLYWGISAFSRLRGMFAFALYDQQKMLTYLVRDTMGIKPLYYHTIGEQLSFASEVRAFKAAQIVTEEDANWRVRFLAYGHLPEPHTTLKGVFSLEKGHFLTWDHRRSNFVISSYHIEHNCSLITTIADAETKIRNQLSLAIDRQLLADAPIGVFLSGGVDSSLLTLLANRKKSSSLNTISIYFDEKAYDERSYQKLILNKIEGNKFTHLVKQHDFATLLPQTLQAMDMPTTDGINTWFISKYAHEDGLKAVLSGVGADELFGGYPSFNRIKYLQYLKKINPNILSFSGSLVPDQYKKIEYLANDHPLADYLFLRGLFSPTVIAEILNTSVKHVNRILFPQTEYIINRYDKVYAAWMESNLYMQNQLLRDTDVMSMRHGLEVRVPFLDEDFQDLVSHISPGIRFNNTVAKKLLVDSFKDLLPNEIWNRSKMGFSFPLQQWMLQSENISDYNLYQGKATKAIVEQFRNNKLHWSKCFALFLLKEHE